VVGAEAIPLAVGAIPLGVELGGELGAELGGGFGFEKTSFRLTLIIYYMQQIIKHSKLLSTANY
jgi:hypothetical protein